MLHRGPVALRAHDDADFRVHGFLGSCRAAEAIADSFTQADRRRQRGDHDIDAARVEISQRRVQLARHARDVVGQRVREHRQLAPRARTRSSARAPRPCPARARDRGRHVVWLDRDRPRRAARSGSRACRARPARRHRPRASGPDDRLDRLARHPAGPQQHGHAARQSRRSSTRRRPRTARRRARSRRRRRDRATTWSAVVGLTAPNRFALGAATPPPNARNSACASGCAGTRSPTVSAPPVVASATRGPRRRITVSGPGHAAATSRRAASGISRAQPSSRAPGREVDDQRMRARPALHGEDLRRRLVARRIGAEPVDGLGRKRDEPAGAQHVGGRGDVGAALHACGRVATIDGRSRSAARTRIEAARALGRVRLRKSIQSSAQPPRSPAARTPCVAQLLREPREDRIGALELALRVRGAVDGDAVAPQVEQLDHRVERGVDRVQQVLLAPAIARRLRYPPSRASSMSQSTITRES